MAASVGNVPQLIQAIITSHAVRTYEIMQCTGPQQHQIYVSANDHWFAKHLRISEFEILYQEQGTSRTSGSIFISHSSWNLRVRFVVKLQIPTVSGSMHVEWCDCFV